MKKHLFFLPEIFISAVSIYWFYENYSSSGHVNYFAIVVFFIVALQIFLKNKIIGVVLGSMLFLFGTFMVLAVLSEFKKFPTINSAAIQLISVGLLICFVLITSSIGLFYKALSKTF